MGITRLKEVGEPALLRGGPLLNPIFAIRALHTTKPAVFTCVRLISRYPRRSRETFLLKAISTNQPMNTATLLLEFAIDARF